MECKICEKIQAKPCPNCNKATLLSWKIAVSIGDKNVCRRNAQRN